MKRMKFLNGIGAMFALVGVAIATTFTSCEKEDFNVNVDPINAQATIETTVLYVDETGTRNVTDLANIEYSAGPTFTGNPTLSAQPGVRITASYNGLTESTTVDVPALGAGQFLSMSATIILQEAAPAPVNARAEVKPVVLLSANGILTDITADATITFVDDPDGDGVFEGVTENGGILEATTCDVTAAYGELEPQTITVDIPRLLAGMSVTLNPVIILTQMPEDAPALAEIRPIVLYMTPTAVVDVTEQATITYNPADVFTGTPNLEATKAEVTATYEGLTGSITVNVPALSAGEYRTLTPVIVLMNAVEEPTITVVSNVTGTTEVENKSQYEDNVSDYWYNTTVTYTEKLGNEVKQTNIQTTDGEEIAFINSFAKEVNTYSEVSKNREIPVYAHSRTIVNISYKATEVTYSFYRVMTLQPQTKADGQELIGSVVVTEYHTEFDSQLNQQIPGHGHAPMGHGHGFDHGHGNGNAGGGIVVAD